MRGGRQVRQQENTTAVRAIGQQASRIAKVHADVDRKAPPTYAARTSALVGARQDAQMQGQLPAHDAKSKRTRPSQRHAYFTDLK
jgi:hypothetical protein